MVKKANGRCAVFSVPSYILTALDTLSEKGFEAFVVGGAVRDMLRGAPVHDYDVTTDASPDEIKRVFHSYRTVDTGIGHGTVTVLIEGVPVEITTYRIDGEYTDKRHPVAVTFTKSLKEDAARRDFTVNAMAYHPKVGIKDFFGGQYEYIAFDNPLYFDEEKFIARSLSGSYSLKDGDLEYKEYIEQLLALFKKYSNDGIVSIANQSVAYIGTIK